MRIIIHLVLMLYVALWSSLTHADTMKMAVTTSFHNSGLSDVLLPEIKKDTGIEVQLLVVGTGQALKLGQRGDVDAVLVHSRKAEDAFIKSGYGIKRTEIMYNDFVIIGPKNDPAGIKKSETVLAALKKIASKKVSFISRGDESGTHKRERILWKEAGLMTDAFDASWYLEVGAGMGAALNIASGSNSYILADRASWLNFKNRGKLALLYAGDKRLINQYAYLKLNDEKHPHIKAELSNKLEMWLTSLKGQKLIGSYKISGETLFVPNAKKGKKD